jgi:hypothetical protein
MGIKLWMGEKADEASGAGHLKESKAELFDPGEAKVEGFKPGCMTSTHITGGPIDYKCEYRKKVG